MASTTKEPSIDSIEKDILIIDRDFNILDANSHLLNRLNINKRDAIGKKCYRVTRCDPPDESCPLLEVLKTGKSTTKRRICLDESGNMVFMEVMVYPLVEGENTDKFIHIVIDITELVDVEREVKEYVSTVSKKIGRPC